MMCSRRRRWGELSVSEPAVVLISLHGQSRRTRVVLSGGEVEQRLVHPEGEYIAGQIDVAEQGLCGVDLVEVLCC